MKNPEEVARLLAEPFEADEVKWKPQAVSGSRAMAIAYVSSRAVMDRLDEVLGVGNWQTSFREIPDGIICRLRVKLNGDWADHEDVGGFSAQPDDGDKLKAAFSDALKRVAVHVGVGRYLYSLPRQWVDYDPQKKQFARAPELPTWANPAELRKARADALKICEPQAAKGVDSLRLAYRTLSGLQKKALNKADVDRLHEAAKDADERKADPRKEAG